MVLFYFHQSNILCTYCCSTPYYILICRYDFTISTNQNPYATVKPEPEQTFNANALRSDVVLHVRLIFKANWICRGFIWPPPSRNSLFLQSAALTFFQLSSIMKIKSGELIASFQNMGGPEKKLGASLSFYPGREIKRGILL